MNTHTPSDTTRILETGYTLVEVIVTIVILSIFLTFIFQTSRVLESQRIAVSQQAGANDIANDNLRLVTSRTGISCDVSGSNLINSGYTLASDLQKTVGSGATQTLMAYPTAGCSGTAFIDNPIRVVSTVEYYVNGSGNRSVIVHAIFIN
ncbi:MAG: prepilin-type N-terminal cleavage/methylation domain-containing protein [Candidatus Saccharimonadales bacterium]